MIGPHAVFRRTSGARLRRLRVRVQVACHRAVPAHDPRRRVGRRGRRPWRAGSEGGSGSRSAARSGSACRPSAQAGCSCGAATGAGAAFISACVYGWSGSRKRSAVGECSTIRPRYITATLRLMWRITARLCAMKRYVRPSWSWRLHHQVQHLRLDRHVERRDGLVGDDELRLDGERAGDPDPLPLPAAELVRLAVGRAPAPARRVSSSSSTRSRRAALGAEPVHRQHLARASGARSSSG